jgi:L-rhamnonate dehydratase
MKITDVLILRVQGRYSGPAYPLGDRQVKALDLYLEFGQAGPPGTIAARQPGSAIDQLFVEIQSDEGVSGIFGPIDDWEVAPIVRSLRPFLLGRDPLATELLHDQMMRIDRHGRSGFFMTAISVLDCALWDLKGKAWGQPVYRLLGGPTRPAVPAYASMLGFASDPAQAAEAASEYKALGFTAQKWFFRYGPGDGAAGIEKNLALAEAVRAAVGPYYELMFDAYMGWNVTYACEMVRRLAPIRLAWLEEAIPPERVGEFRKIRAAASFPIATGEHVYTRWQTKELLVGEAVDVLQNDPDWTGGITEQMKICALASAFETPVVAHGHSLLPALHVAGAQSPAVVPRVEYLVRSQETKQYFFKPIYRPEGGEITLPTLPGLGLGLDEEKIEQRERVEG